MLSDQECCVEMLDSNSSCPERHQCSPGCFLRWNQDGSSSCVRCRNGSQINPTGNELRECRNSGSKLNISAESPESFGSSGVAVSLVLGSFSISLFLILSVAFFFFLKRSNKLPKLFDRKNKASVLQPNETVSSVPSAASVRKPRYVRRDRSATPKDSRVSHV